MNPTFTEWEVTRIGEIVVLSVFTDQPPPGAKLQVTLTLPTREEAETHERMLQHLVECAQLLQHMPEAALQGTLQLIKGQDS